MYQWRQWNEIHVVELLCFVANIHSKGRLKMHHWKMTDGINHRGGKCRNKESILAPLYLNHAAIEYREDNKLFYFSYHSLDQFLNDDTCTFSKMFCPTCLLPFSLSQWEQLPASNYSLNVFWAIDFHNFLTLSNNDRSSKVSVRFSSILHSCNC